MVPDSRILQGLDWLIISIRGDLRSVTRRVRAEHAHYLAVEEQKRRQRIERGKQSAEKRATACVVSAVPLGALQTRHTAACHHCQVYSVKFST
jgi:hypothetical protein